MAAPRCQKSTRLKPSYPLVEQKLFTDWKEGPSKNVEKIDVKRVHRLCDEFNRILKSDFEVLQ